MSETEEIQAEQEQHNVSVLEKEPNPNHKWYVVHTQSGYEMKAKSALEKRIENEGKADFFTEVLIPAENVVELVKDSKGKKAPKERKSTRKFFPGYILVKMELTDETYHLVKGASHITGFVGGTRHPPVVPEDEVNRILTQIQDGTLKPKPKVMFERGDSVRVVQGPFANFNGTVDDVSPEKAKLTVLVSIFGRSTPVELDFLQVEKQ